MIRINQIKIPIFEVGSDKETELRLLSGRAAKLLKCRTLDIRKLAILKRSIDARDKSSIQFVYSVNVRLHDSVTGPRADTELAYIKGLRNKNITQETKLPLSIPKLTEDQCKGSRPVVVGSGPCGLFAAFALAEAGLKPIILERGTAVEERVRKTELFFESGKLDPECNIQFGEGGAGTFSDGKLNTGIKDPGGFIGYCLKTFVRFGADERILYDQKPHIGTDVLREVIRNMRTYLEEKGVDYRFRSRFEKLILQEGKVCGLVYTDLKSGETAELQTDSVVLAVGHSARDTYRQLLDAGIPMEPKAFAVGVRVQHPQDRIDEALYGKERLKEKQKILGPAAYKLVHSAANGRSIYSFCMCPGGYVVNSSSEEGKLCINGMSYHKRDSGIANSALIVNVTPEDYPDCGILSGVEFQRRLEKAAFDACGGVIPYETFGEFRDKEKNPQGVTAFEPKFLGYYGAADVRGILPDYIGDAIEEGMHAFSGTIRGYDSDDAIIAGIEARTSSPVRIIRNEQRMSPAAEGLYPAGEGAGYAGGITSAAVDGIKTALQILENSKGNGND